LTGKKRAKGKAWEKGRSQINLLLTKRHGTNSCGADVRLEKNQRDSEKESTRGKQAEERKKVLLNILLE